MADVAALVLPGTNGNYASAPDSVATSITSDIDLRCRVALTDWTPASEQQLVGKWTATGNQRAYRLAVESGALAGQLRVFISSDGIALPTADSGVAVSASDGDVVWVRATWRASDGRVQFFTASGSLSSPSSGDWTQLGTDQTLAVGSIKDSTAVVEVGTVNVGTSSPATGKFYRAQIYSGIAGTLVFDADFTAVAATAVRTPSTFTESSSNAATVTCNGTTWSWFTVRSATALGPLGGLTGTAAATPTVTATGNAALGGLTAAATATVTVPATAAAPLGSLTATAVGTVTVPAIAQSSLGGLSATATASVISGSTATGTAELGPLTASASALITVPATGSAPIGGLTGTASGILAITGVGNASLGFTATATGNVTVLGVAVANLGPLVAQAVVRPEGTTLRLRVSGREPRRTFSGRRSTQRFSGREPVSAFGGRERGTPPEVVPVGAGYSDIYEDVY